MYVFLSVFVGFGNTRAKKYEQQVKVTFGLG